MNQAPKTVSIHPYFKVHPDRLEAVKALLPAFVGRTAAEAGNLYYDFTMNGDELFCREAYVGAEGALAHVENVRELLGQLLAMASLLRLEVHGPAAELDKLRGPLAALNPVWFVYQTGVGR